MTRAFALCFAIGLVMTWVSLSTEHGRVAGKKIKKIIREFFKGRKQG